MKSILYGCVVGILSLVILSAVGAQTDSLPPLSDPQILIEATDEPIPTLEPSLAPEIEIVATETSISLIEIEALIVTVEPSPEATSELVISPAVTESVIILSPSNATVEILPSETLTPTSTSTLTLRSIEGQALYPNRVLGQAFIRVQAFAPDNTLLSTAYTDANGFYAVTGLTDQVTRIEIEASLHLPETLYLAPGVMPLPTTLRAGDIDGDLCVGRNDIEILSQHYGKVFVDADIDGSGVVDVIDLTLLSGNYDAACVPSIIVTEATPTAVTPVGSDTDLVSEEMSAAPSPTEVFATLEVSSTEETTAPDTPFPTNVPTETPVSVEVTAEATAQS